MLSKVDEPLMCPDIYTLVEILGFLMVMIVRKEEAMQGMQVSWVDPACKEGARNKRVRHVESPSSPSD